MRKKTFRNQFDRIYILPRYKSYQLADPVEKIQIEFLRPKPASKKMQTFLETFAAMDADLYRLQVQADTSPLDAGALSQFLEALGKKGQLVHVTSYPDAEVNLKLKTKNL